MSMEPTEKELDEMVASEIEHAEIEARKTPQQKMQDQFDIINRCWANIQDIFDKLSKV